jgi:hypothetical protein
MEGWDLEKVKELAGQYNAAGLGDTSSGRFLSSLVAAAAPPRGNGVRWLADLLAKGDPRRFKVQLDEVLQLAAACPTLDLAPLVRSLQRGEPLVDWQKKTLEEARAQAQEPCIELTPEEGRILRELCVMKVTRSAFYWGSRPGISARLDRIFNRFGADHPIRRSDFDYACDQFGPAVREMRNPTFKQGDLVSVPGDLIGMVVSEPFAGSTVLYDILVNGKVVSFPLASLRKRIKR